MASRELYRTFRRLLHAAQRFERRAPKYQRVEAERQQLRDAITDAALVLSVEDSASGQDAKQPARGTRPRNRVA
jgi:hypothetical protein